MWLPNPIKFAETIRDTRTVLAGGGPALIRLVKVGEPHGLVFQSAEVVVEVETRDGERVRFDPQLPLPFVWGWSVRLARMLKVPLISSIEPEHFRFQVKLPGAG